MNLGEAGESGITFETLDDHVDSSPSEADVDPDAVDVPEIDLDKQEDVGSKIADEKTRSDKQEMSNEKPDSGIKRNTEEEQEAIAAMIEFGEEKFEIQRLMEDENERRRLQDLIKNGALMRSDYSKKTAAHSEAVRAWEGQRQADIDRFRNYLNETNQVFNGSPLAFLRQSFGRDENGQPLAPEVVESRLKGWLDKLSDQLEKGSSYDPEADLKQYEIEKRLNQIEAEKKMAEQQRLQREEARKVSELTDHIVGSVLKSIPKDEVFTSFVDSMPGLKEKMVEAVINQVDKSRQEVYNPTDPTWDDKMFVDTYNFEKHWNEQLELFMKSYDRAYDKYVEKKASASKRKPARSSNSNANSGIDNDKWTFAKMFAND